MTSSWGIYTRTPQRLALDRIRRELGMERQKNPCPWCGDERWKYDQNGRGGHPVEHCETCRGKRVVAANILRVIIGHARQGVLGKSSPGLGDRRFEEDSDATNAGAFETVTPMVRRARL